MIFTLRPHRIIKCAREFGDCLIVGLSSDEFNKGKGKECIFNYTKRKELLEAIKYVDKIIEEVSWDQKVNDIRDNKVDIFVMGDDWEGKFDFLKEFCEVIYLPRTPFVSTTILKNALK